mgnify:CR=1 FL=1
MINCFHIIREYTILPQTKIYKTLNYAIPLTFVWQGVKTQIIKHLTISMEQWLRFEFRYYTLLTEVLEEFILNYVRLFSVVWDRLHEASPCPLGIYWAVERSLEYNIYTSTNITIHETSRVPRSCWLLL